MRSTGARGAIALASLTVLVSCAGLMLLQTPEAEDWDPPGAPAAAPTSDTREACARSNPQREAFFGDLHVHTAYSFDARSRDMLATPDDAYRFARGEAIGFGPFDAEGRGARQLRLERPLDFAAVTDHAEWIGEVNLCTTPGSKTYDTKACRTYRGEVDSSEFFGLPAGAGRFLAIVDSPTRKSEVCGPDAAFCRESLVTAWQATQQATERWYDRSAKCRFTTFHGWEHTYSPALSKVHRNVIFRNAAVPELPISSLESPNAIDLWDRLDAVCKDTDSGCEAVTIPHNPNVSNGRLFEITWADAPLEEQKRQARVRARMEPVVEMMQVKGESECKNGMYGVVGGPDELCDFEKIRRIDDGRPEDCEEGTGGGAIRGLGCQSRVDFARYALIEGLREEERIGINPFRFGFVGSTDTHNASPGDTEEASYPGCCASTDTTVRERLSPRHSFAGRPGAARNPGGLMGVWAEENSRDSLFDAIQRRETFATSGPRMQVRFFGGWELGEDLCTQKDLVKRGYAGGVPMGGVLEASNAKGAPVFVASALRDPGFADHPGGALDRLQIIKAWYGEDGLFHQEVHDVAGRVAEGGQRKPATVDMNTCEPRGAGADTLCAVWSDPSFDAKRAAVYYVRAVENPSCRWSWQQCLTLPEDSRPTTCNDPAIPRTIQERAWTSPIWYAPGQAG